MVSVYLFVPNLIGYTRVLLAFIAFYVCFDEPILFLVLYAISEILDAVDGYAARALNQSSKYGAVLDMVTDRASTTSLIVVLSKFYPERISPLMLLIVLDLTSHFAHLYSTLIRGATSHKSISPEQSWFLQIYYTSRVVLFILCFCNEALFLTAYAWHFWDPEIILFGHAIAVAKLLFYLFLPLCSVKQFMNLVQLIQAGKDLVAVDVAERNKKS